MRIKYRLAMLTVVFMLLGSFTAFAATDICEDTGGEMQLMGGEYQLHGWISFAPMGECYDTDKYFLTDKIYFMYRTENLDGSSVWLKDLGYNDYTITQYLYYPDGTLLKAKVYPGSESGYMEIQYDPSMPEGIYRGKIEISGDTSAVVDLSWDVNPKKYKVTYNSNGGITCNFSSEYEKGELVDLRQYAIKEGWEFLGWNTNKNATTVLSSYTVTGDVTLYAIYKKTIDVNFYSVNNLLQHSISKTVYSNGYDNPWVNIGTIEPDEMEGWTTCGWRTDKEAIEPPAMMSNICTESTNFYAVYKKDVVLTYDTDGAETATPASQTGVKYWNAGETLKLPYFTLADAPVKSGCTFKGWEVEYVTYDAGDEVKLPSSQTALAIWEKNERTVTYDYSTNGGNVATKTTAKVGYGENADLSVTATKSGWEFVGWNTNKNATVALSSYTVTGDVTLYAIYKKTIEVDFYSKYQYLQKTISKTIYNNSTYIDVEYPQIEEYAGWTAAGWQTAMSAMSPIENLPATASESKVFYAIYSRDLTLSFNANGGNSVPSAQSKLQYRNSAGYIQRIKFTLPSAINRAGYVFDAWCENSTSGTKYAPGSTIEITSSTVMYASWTEDTYTITYDYSTNKGDSATKSKAVVGAGQAVDLSVTATRAGWEFVGWNTNKDATVSLDSLYVDEDTVLYAIFKKDLTMTYIARANECVKKETKTIYNRDYCATFTPPTDIEYNGWEELGWEDDIYAIMPTYRRWANISIEEDTTLYAVYIKPTTVTFDAKGGETPEPIITTPWYNASGNVSGVAITMPTSTKSGYRLKGWKKTEFTSSTIYSPGSEYYLSGDVTVLYAVWEVSGYTVTYNYSENGGDSATHSTRFVTPGSYADLSATATKSGWEFVGWNTDPNETTACTRWAVYGNITLYAIFKKDIDVKFYSNENELQREYTKSIYNKEEYAEIVTEQPIDMEGWEYLGWRSDTECKDKQYVINQILHCTRSITFYGIYKRDITLSYNALEGIDQTKTQYYNSGGGKSEVKFLLADAPEKAGYVFKNWEIDGVFYNPGDEVTLDGDKTAYALWETSERTVTYDYRENGGDSASEETSVVAVGALADLSVTATKSGWTFVGWNTDKNAKATLESYLVTEDVTLYAIFKKDIDVKFYSKENELQREYTKSIYNKEEYAEVVMEEPDGLEGWRATGWRSDTESKEKQYEANQTLQLSADATFYGVYSRHVYLEYDTEGGQLVVTPSELQYRNAHGEISGAKFTVGSAIWKTGYSFEGWEIDGALYDPGDEVIIFESQVAHAKWKIIEITVVYNYSENGGDSATKTTDVVPYFALADLSVTATKSGWEFVGWNTDKNAKAALESCIVTEDVTLYAIFKKDIDVKFYSKENELQREYTKSIYNKEEYAEVVMEEPEGLEGWRTTGWRSDTDSTNGEFNVHEVVRLSEDATLYAVYERKITLSYDADGGMGTPDAQWGTQYYNSGGRKSEVEFVLVDAPENKGHTFLGWAVNYPKSELYSAYETVCITEDTKMYAIWNKKERGVIANGICGENAEWILYEDGELIICGYGEISTDTTMYGWRSYMDRVKRVSVEKGITNLEGGMFTDCSALAVITIASTVENISNPHGIFKGATTLTTIIVNDSNGKYSSVDGVLFNKDKTVLLYYPCGKSGDYKVPDTTTRIGESAFYGAQSLKGVYVAESVVIVESRNFLDCDNAVVYCKEGSEAHLYAIKYKIPHVTSALKHLEVKKTDEGDSVSFDIEVEDAEETYKVFAVGINSYGESVDFKSAEISTDDPEIEFDKNDSVDKVRIFVWDDKLRPITETKDFGME